MKAAAICSVLVAAILGTSASGCDGTVTVKVDVDPFTLPVKSTFGMVCYQPVTPDEKIGTVRKATLRMEGLYTSGGGQDPNEINVTFYARLTDPAADAGAMTLPESSVVCVQPGSDDVALSTEIAFVHATAQEVEFAGDVLAAGLEQPTFWTGAAVSSSTTPVMSDTAVLAFSKGVATVTVSN